MIRPFPRAIEPTVVLSRELYNRMVESIERANNVTVAGTLELTNFPNGIGITGTGGAPMGFIPVHVTNDGGTYGSSTTSNTATYTVKTLGDKDMADGASTTATHKTPEWNERIAHVAYLPPPTGAICIACYDTATPPALHLLYVPEKFGGTDCNTPGSGS